MAATHHLLADSGADEADALDGLAAEQAVLWRHGLVHDALERRQEVPTENKTERITKQQRQPPIPNIRTYT